MRTWRRFGVIFCCSFLLVPFAARAASVSAAAETSEEAGVSRLLAETRAARLSNIRYDVHFSLVPHAATVPGEETLRFDDSGSGDLALDYRDGLLLDASLNGKTLSVALVNGHLMLTAALLTKGPNELKLRFTSNVATTGKAITRYEDRDDHSEYIYTLFVPMDASMAFPCFDQPDLKARFTLHVDAPTAWKVVANTASDSTVSHGVSSTRNFPETRPISTYLFAFAAGPWAEIPGAKPGEPALYVRQSQLSRARSEAPDAQQMAARGISFFSEYFAQPFPFPKYDLVLIPGFPFGGMEHAGETFLNEDGVLFRAAPTASDYFRRKILVLHETCHQWFGDLVTMRWFDDLWLKEGFAQYMAYKALAQLEPEDQPWKHFYEEIKPAAYAIDETQGTTPIFQNIANLRDAKSAYGAIVYQKAPAVLKQLNYFLGENNFRDGLRMYLKEHAYSNARWSDLIGAFEQASAANHAKRDVQGWAKAWILQRGMPEVTVSYSCSTGRIAGLSLHQRDVLGTEALWPISELVMLSYPDRPPVLIPVMWSGKEAQVVAASGKTCPDYVFANADDEAYGRFLLDPLSEKAVSRDVVQPGAQQRIDPLLRTMLWGALWENVHVAKSPALSYVQLATRDLSVEQDESLMRIQGGRLAVALHDYLGPKSRNLVLGPVEETLSSRMSLGETPGLRIVAFRSLTSIAETDRTRDTLKNLLNGSVKIQGVDLRAQDRWNIIGHLIVMNDPDAQTLYATEKANDRSGEGQKYAYAVEAGDASAEVKARYFQQYLHSSDVQEDWITQSLRPFNAWNQTDLTEPYLTKALDALEEIKQHRKIFFLGNWLSAFIDGQHSAAAQATVQQWLAHAEIDPDLRLKVLEVADALDRTVMIRSKFPD
jgi:aminopeptidase N